MDSLDKHEQILTLSRLGDRWAEHNLRGEPDWRPLLSVLGSDRSYDFMWMARVADRGTVIELYKHQVTRRYLNLDSDTRSYRWIGSFYKPIPLGIAIEYVFADPHLVLDAES